MEPLSPETFGVTADLTAISVNSKLLLTAGLIAGIFLLRFLLILFVRGERRILSDRQRRWILRIRNIASFAAIAAIILLWASELEAFVFSIAAFAVAIVIASKELLMCLAGGIMRSTSGAFTVGDWIEVGTHSGEVVDITATTTQLQEFDRVEFEHTGRVISLPNSLFLSNAVINHAFRKRYIFHEFVITAEPHPRIEELRQHLQAALTEAAKPFHDVAERYRNVLENRSGIDLPDGIPEVRIRTTDFAKIRYEARIFCPREKAGEMEQAAIQAFLAWTEAQDWTFAGTQAG
ncbi:MAG: mechanosensitive ion channel domain-containing protein [Pseudomonadota bacterium]